MANDRLQLLHRSVNGLHTECLDTGHHQAHVAGQPVGAVRSQLYFESRRVITALGDLLF